MEKGKILVYYGEGKGKTTSALGHGIRCASQGKQVIIVQFLKGKNEDEMSFIRRLEPEIKLFSFEKSEGRFEDLSEGEKQEECMNIRNGFNYARKVLATGECNVLILDELLGVLDNQVITSQELQDFLAAKPEETEIIFTGRVLDESLKKYVDEVYQIQAIPC